MPAVRTFSLFAGTAVLLNFLFQVREGRGEGGREGGRERVWGRDRGEERKKVEGREREGMGGRETWRG